MSEYVLENGFNTTILTSFFERKSRSFKKNKHGSAENELKVFVDRRYEKCLLVVEEYSEFNTYFNEEESMPTSYKCDMIQRALPMLPTNPDKCRSLAKYFLQFDIVVYSNFIGNYPQSTDAENKKKKGDQSTSKFIESVKSILQNIKDGKLNDRQKKRLEKSIDNYYRKNCQKIMNDYNMFNLFYRQQRYHGKSKPEDNCDLFVRHTQNQRKTLESQLKTPQNEGKTLKFMLNTPQE